MVNSFKKTMRPFELTLQGNETFLTWSYRTCNGAMKSCLPSGKSEGSVKVWKSVQSWPDSPGQYTDSWPCKISLRQGHRVTVAFVVGWLVLLWWNAHAKMCKCGGVSQRITDNEVYKLFTITDGAVT